jgi:hypothetical protein
MIERETLYSRFDPQVTPSVLADMPDCLRAIIEDTMNKKVRSGRHRAILVSSNSLANRFILAKWGIRPSQRKRYRNLFAAIRSHSRRYFLCCLTQKRVEWHDQHSATALGVYRFDDIRGNVILGFVEDELVGPGKQSGMKLGPATL